MAKRHLVVCNLVEPGLRAVVVLYQCDAIHTPDASGGHDIGVAALLLQVALQELCLQPLDTAGYLEKTTTKAHVCIMCEQSYCMWHTINSAAHY